MKKLAIGCVALLAVGIAGGAAAAYLTYHKVSTTVKQFTQLGSADELERSIRKQGPYTPPASGEPSPAQIERLVQVQQAVGGRVGRRVDAVQRRYRRYFKPADGKTWSGGTVDSALVVVGFYRDVAGIYVEGKQAQVDALNRAGLSLEEYRWIRSRVYAALGVPLVELNIAGVIAEVREGRQPAAPVFRMQEDSAGSPAVRQIAEPHRQALEESAGLAFFGL